MWRAAALAQPLLRRPESDVCRAVDPDWWWRDPLFAVVANAVGVKTPKKKRTQGVAAVASAGVRKASISEVQELLETRRT